MKQSIGNFLLRRLQEAGIRHIFGVPGDYNLELMQQLEDRGEPAWIGNCNELNASYATDAYARINGLGALIVTHGVGALSAINGIAGAYSEHVPVICISGSLPLRAIQRGDLMHHTLADREKGNFCRIFAEVTDAQAQTHSGECGSGDRSAHSDGVAPKTSRLPGTALRHLLSRDRGARTSSQTRNDPRATRTT